MMEITLVKEETLDEEVAKDKLLDYYTKYLKELKLEEWQI